MRTFIFTCGDPNGIGPEIVIKTINEVYNSKDRFIVISPKNVFTETAQFCKPKFKYHFYSASTIEDDSRHNVKVFQISGKKLVLGKPTKSSGKISYTSLNIAVKLLERFDSSAMITAPISKKAWGMNNIKYEGHTDFLGEYFDVKNPLMIFYSKKMIAGLVTIHQPIKNIPSLITKTKLKNTIAAFENSLMDDFSISNPQIAILGLNPHAGENGKIGKEEEKIIKPVLQKLGKENIHGPFVPDAFFGKKLYKQFDAVLGMYHDQVLIPFKMLNFDSGVNFTANLPIVRTSPDHGTAYDIAGKNIADPKSTIQAFRLAKKILINREQ